MIDGSSLKNLLVTLFIGLSIGGAGTAALTTFTGTAPAQSRETASAIERDARYLASEALMGRGVDTAGIKLARDYIAAEFAKYGLRPGGDEGSFLQSFELAVGVQVQQPSSLSLSNRPPLALASEWTPLGLSTSGKVEAELVFVGYGITAKEHGYDDYAGVDVQGKLALVLRHEPPPQGASSPFKKYPGSSIHSALRTKANNAREHGAAGMILVDLHRSQEEQELLSTGSSLWRGGRSLPAAQVKRAMIEQALADRGISLLGLKEKIDRSGQPASMPLGSTAALEVSLQEIRRPAENVVAVLPGAHPKISSQNVVIGAHYDHLGRGHFGAFDPRSAGAIHPGADDNASGTAVLLDVARRLAQSPIRPARSIVFVAFSGEELGLYGSRHFVQTFPAIASTQAMLNLDMVGRLRDDRITVFGARSGQGLSAIVSAAAHSGGLQLSEADDVGRSDHLTFYNRQIPVLHFFTGIHSDYHRPGDTADKLNYAGMEKVSEMVARALLELANRAEPPQFVALPSRSARQQMGDAAGLNAYLGSIPEYGTEARGVQLAGVVAGSPAAVAGLRTGDVIIRFGLATIQTIEDLTAALGAHKPGDRVEIVALRAGARINLTATLQSRRSSDRG
jgi:hypothetical protein